MSINRELWLGAIKDTVEPVTDDPDAVTTAEFAALYNCGRLTASKRLTQLVEDGRVTKCTKWIADSGGRRLRVTAWSLKTPKKAKR